MKAWLKRFLVVAALGLFVVFGSRIYLLKSADGRIHRSVSDVPHQRVAIVLGAGVWPNNTPSPALRERVAGGVQLLKAGTVDKLLMSGDNSRVGYDEPTLMRQLALDAGVKESEVALDYAGFDTWASCRRAHDVFGLRQAIVVTHSFHVDRAIALCRSAGIDADGYSLPDDLGSTKMRELRVREFVASTKAMFDIATNRDPKFLGPKEHI